MNGNGTDRLCETPVSLSDLVVCGFLDSATGRGAKRRTGDFAAIATVGADRAGYFYVLDVWLRRAAPTAQIAAMFDLHARWRYALFGIETNCFQELLLLPIEEERKRRREASGRDSTAWQIPIREVHHSQNKETRIATLEPLVTNGWLRFATGLPDPFWAQMESFPHGEHDDALDAIEGAVSLLRSCRSDARRGPRRAALNTLSHY
ncbi:phage terminase large subunit [Candidatus Sumerlaeota bacterium]|nr:phage terminase large subunit [Candidatus Sumerlaeota bacterium]